MLWYISLVVYFIDNINFYANICDTITFYSIFSKLVIEINELRFLKMTTLKCMKQKNLCLWSKKWLKNQIVICWKWKRFWITLKINTIKWRNAQRAELWKSEILSLKDELTDWISSSMSSKEEEWSKHWRSWKIRRSESKSKNSLKKEKKIDENSENNWVTSILFLFDDDDEVPWGGAHVYDAFSLFTPNFRWSSRKCLLIWSLKLVDIKN